MMKSTYGGLLSVVTSAVNEPRKIVLSLWESSPMRDMKKRNYATDIIRQSLHGRWEFVSVVVLELDH